MLNIGLSIIVPTYNRSSEQIVKAIDCLLKQNISNKEIIIIDQNKSDVIKNLILSYKNNTIKYYKQEHPNVSLARNNGAQMAKYNLLMFIDDDVLPEPDFCISAIDILNKEKEIKCLAPVVYNYEGKNVWIERYKRNNSKEKIKNIFIIPHTLSACFFIYKSDFFNIGGFDPFLFNWAKSAEDFEFFTRASKREVNLFLSLEISVYHSEEKEGGCDFRSIKFWDKRALFSRAWIYYNMINNNTSNLNFKSYYSIARLAFFNKTVIKSGFLFTYKCFKSVLNEIPRTKKYFDNLIKLYPELGKRNFLNNKYQEIIDKINEIN